MYIKNCPRISESIMMYLVTTFVAILYLNVSPNTAQFSIYLPSVKNINDFHSDRRYLGPLEEIRNLTFIPNDYEVADSFVDVDLKMDEVNYYLYTKDNKEEAVSLQTNDTAQLKDSSFNLTRPTKIIIHGWTDSGNSGWVQDMRRNYLSVGDYNVICVNWFKGSTKEYLTSVRLTRQVGEYLAAFLEFLVAEAQLSLADVHIVGHSLGAHIAGYTSNYVSGKLGRITGLDPARPAFEAPYLRNPEERLDFTDADFVDIIHTSPGNVGFLYPFGHADFYMNGITPSQPGCPILSTFHSRYCSHGRSHQFFAESIVRPESFVATRCTTWMDLQLLKCNNTSTVMGEYISPETRGIYFLRTNAQSPFGKGKT